MAETTAASASASSGEQQDELTTLLLSHLETHSTIEHSIDWCTRASVEHLKFVARVQSLQSLGYVKATPTHVATLELTKEAQAYADAGSPEAQVFAAVAADGGTLQSALRAQLGTVAAVGWSQAMKRKWLRSEKEGKDTRAHRAVASIDDTLQTQLRALRADAAAPDVDVKALRARQLVATVNTTWWRVERGARFATTVRKQAAELTAEQVASGAWRSLDFKPYNLNALGKELPGGHLHPLLKVRTQFREILLEMGFEEMPTNQWVESAFWNFDTLWQPQAHPARDAHDTFFLTEPRDALRLPDAAYVDAVKTSHENGGTSGSIGWRYDWKLSEAQKNLLRTHTTAVSARMLARLAADARESGVYARKYFSIDRVFRNESMDATHLAEFHQVEGLVCDRGLSLSNLIGQLRTFYARIGITNLRFKPAYNPYTEPSMEIFGYHPQLKKWVEVGNSGMFRPEMLAPMGFPADVQVIAWGLSLERPTMILYEVDNIRNLYGHKVDLNFIRKNPLCRLDKVTG